MTARPARLALAGLVAATLVASCTTTADEAATPAASPRTLTVMLADDWASADAVVDAITDFEAEHGVRVVTRPAAFSELEEFMFADRSGPKEIDVSQWHAFAAGALGLAQDVTVRFSSEYDDDLFVPGAVEDVTWDDRVYGVPLDVNAMVLVVNTTLLDELGHSLDELATWDGVEAVARSAEQLRIGGGDHVAFTHLPNSTWSLFAWLRANGGRWFTRDPGTGTTTLQLSSPEVHETFAFLQGLTSGGRAVADDETDTDADAYPLFVEGRTLALASGTWDVARLEDDANVDFEWAVVPMPQGPSADGPGTVLGGSSLYVTEHADDAALAWEFVTHLVEPEYALRYAEDDGRLPARTDVLADELFDQPRYATAVDALPHASAMQLIVYPRVLDIATKAIFDVLYDHANVRRAFDRAQRAGTEILDGLAAGS